MARIAVYYSRRARLQTLVDAVTPLCEIDTLGVDELAMANLLNPEQRGLMLHKMPGQELTMTFIHQRQWHFSRTIRGFQALDDERMAVDQFVFDNLLLELQRSIDYATGQLRLNPPGNGLWPCRPGLLRRYKRPFARCLTFSQSRSAMSTCRR
ncbi:hypothetical protein MBH78_21745 [Oceanimonas sp. NS1]|nr:hypothetical protein [Oceanimonas sp. NS1]